jgi:hypothetical protein
MKLTEENLDWAMAKIEQLSVLPGAPDKPEHIVTLAKQLLRIVDTNEPCYECCSMPVSKGHLDRVHSMEEDDTAKPTSEETYQPGEWLIEKALAEHRRFPMPIDLRVIFNVRRCPSDGWRPSEFFNGGAK